MIWRIRIALLTSVVMASAICSIQAEDKVDEKKEPVPEKKETIAPPTAPPVAAPLTGGCGSPCAPAYKTVCVTEWVPEYYKTTRTSYKKECVTEAYTAYKTECIPETRTRNVTHYERVCETRDVTKTICEKICVQEERNVYKTHYTCTPETTYVCKTVDKGHWECKEVACSEGFLSKLKGGLFSHKHESCGCADSCGSCGDACSTCYAPPTKTVKVWVSCKVTEQVPCTKMVRHCETVCEKQLVSVYKSVPKTIVVKETFTKCVPVCTTETYTAYVSKCVPYQATRTVTKCVPYTEEVTCSKLVAHTVQKQVACDTCGSSCGSYGSCYEKESFFAKLKSKLASRHHSSCGCEASCGSTCGGCSTCGH